jgi:hypothetical protein
LVLNLSMRFSPPIRHKSDVERKEAL